MIGTADRAEEAGFELIEMVLADGTVLTVGGRDGCYEGGPFDLPGLICGSEGTFGVITALWVRLAPKATSFRTIVATFAASADACNTVSDIIAEGFLPAAMEMMDRACVAAVEASIYAAGYPTDAAAVLLIELDGQADAVEAEAGYVVSLLRERGAREVRSASSPADACSFVDSAVSCLAAASLPARSGWALRTSSRS